MSPMPDAANEFRPPGAAAAKFPNLSIRDGRHQELANLPAACPTADGGAELPDRSVIELDKHAIRRAAPNVLLSDLPQRMARRYPRLQ
jgi:hypothetical protein